MKTKLPILIIFLIFSNLSFSQITKNGYGTIKWKTPKSSINGLKNCNDSQAGENFENCEYTTTDSLFLGKYKYSYCNFRFFKGTFCEANFDLRHKDLGNLVSDLTVKFGSPLIKENKTKTEDPHGNVIGYEWIVGDTKILLLNKGIYSPVWCALSSVSIRKTTRPEINIENLIFE